MIRAVVLAVAVASSSALPAAELVIRDLHLGVGTASREFSYTLDNRTSSASGHDSFDRAWTMEGGGRWSFSPVGQPYGLVIGADASRDMLSYAGGGLDTDWLRAALGGGWAIDDRICLVLEAGGMLGRSTMRNADTPSWPSSGQSGRAQGCDLRLSAPIQVLGGGCIFPFIGYLHAVHALSGDGLDSTITRNSYFIGVHVGWRFSAIPSRLE